jgi:hypothetical protein
MITPEQEADLRLFIKGIEARCQPDDEFLLDSVQEIAAYELEGALSQQRDRAVARYYHRLRMMAVLEQINQ